MICNNTAVSPSLAPAEVPSLSEGITSPLIEITSADCCNEKEVSCNNNNNADEVDRQNTRSKYSVAEILFTINDTMTASSSTTTTTTTNVTVYGRLSCGGLPYCYHLNDCSEELESSNDNTFIDQTKSNTITSSSYIGRLVSLL